MTFNLLIIPVLPFLLRVKDWGPLKRIMSLKSIVLGDLITGFFNTGLIDGVFTVGLIDGFPRGLIDGFCDTGFIDGTALSTR